MATVAIVGGGPAGLSAGLFASKNGLGAVLFDTDKTWMHKAHLFNYPGIGSVGGSEYISIARQQADDFGVDRKQGEKVTAVEAAGDGFVVTTEADEYEADYVVLATGANRDLAESLGCEFDGDLVDVGVSMETSVEGAYATGAMVRAEEWQAVISAGDGAAAALNILSNERGEHYHDFDVSDTATSVFGGVNYPTLLPRRGPRERSSLVITRRLRRLERLRASVLEGGALMWTPGNQPPAIGW